jgi:hypothetical protein
VACLVFSAVSFSFGIANAQNKLRLETKLNSPSFFVRNREEFGKHAVTAFIGGIVGWLVGHFLK